MPSMEEDEATAQGGRGRRPRPSRRARWRRSGVLWLAGAIAMVVVAVVAGPFIYFHAVDRNNPSPLTLPVGPGGTAGPLNGTWTVGPGSQVGYRVVEMLFGQHHTAVARTGKVTGQVVLTGATVTEAQIVVDMASLKSDETGRDTVFRDAIMDTGSHPHGEFTLTRAIQMGTLPPAGKVVEEPATGELTLRGVTHTVTFPLSAERYRGQIVVRGALTIRFARWHIPNPSFAITKVANTGTIDLLLYLRRSG